MVPRLGDLWLELLLTKIERTEKVWGSKREYPELCLDMLSLRCSFAIQWEIISWHSWDSGERFRELVFYPRVDGIWSHEVGGDHVGNMCRQKREVQELGTPTFPGQRATRGKTRKKSEEKQTRMVPWKTEKVFQETGSSAVKYCQWVKEDEDWEMIIGLEMWMSLVTLRKEQFQCKSA